MIIHNGKHPAQNPTNTAINRLNLYLRVATRQAPLGTASRNNFTQANTFRSHSTTLLEWGATRDFLLDHGTSRDVDIVKVIT